MDNLTNAEVNTSHIIPPTMVVSMCLCSSSWASSQLKRWYSISCSRFGSDRHVHYLQIPLNAIYSWPELTCNTLGLSFGAHTPGLAFGGLGLNGLRVQGLGLGFGLRLAPSNSGQDRFSQTFWVTLSSTLISISIARPSGPRSFSDSEGLAPSGKKIFECIRSEQYPVAE